MPTPAIQTVGSTIGEDATRNQDEGDCTTTDARTPDTGECLASGSEEEDAIAMGHQGAHARHCSRAAKTVGTMIGENVTDGQDQRDFTTKDAPMDIVMAVVVIATDRQFVKTKLDRHSEHY